MRTTLAARRAARRQRDRHLAPAAHQARALRQVAREQRRLGDLARALLGHAAADLAQRGGGDGGDQLARRARGAVRRHARRPAPPVRATTSRSRRRPAASRCAACPRSSTCGSTPARCRSPSGARRTPARTIFERDFPADYICEGLDQTRGWFYSLLAVNTLLFGKAPYKDVVCLGLILDDATARRCRSPRATSSRPGTCSTPTAPTRCAGTSSPPSSRGTATSSPIDAVGESLRQFLLQLWNTYGFYTLYANAAGDDYARTAPATAARPLGPSAACARPSPTVTDGAGRATTRRPPAARSPPSSTTSPTGTCACSRRRFWDGDPAAFATLHECLVDGGASCWRRSARSSPTSSTSASTAPSRACTCATSRRPATRDAALEAEMALVRATVEMGRSARAQAKAKNRQPLAAAVVVADGGERDGARAPRRARPRRAQRQGAALRRPRPTSSAPTRSRPTTARSARASARRMPQAAAAIAALDPAHVADALRERPHASASTSTATSTSSARTTSSSRCSRSRATRSSAPARTPSRSTCTLTDELRREGIARELVHAIQSARRDAGLDVSDRIHLGSTATRTRSRPPARTRPTSRARCWPRQ